jgi:hypothetical protein
MAEFIAQPSDYGAMWDMVTAYRLSRLARVAAVLSLPEHLAAGPRTAVEIATAESGDPDATFRVLRLCASVGLATATADGGFSGTPLLATLRADDPGSLRGLALTLSAPATGSPGAGFPKPWPPARPRRRRRSAPTCGATTPPTRASRPTSPSPCPA